MIPVWLAYYLNVPPLLSRYCRNSGLSRPIFTLFFSTLKAEKGVATAFGSIAAIGWDLSGLIAGTWLLTVLLSGYSSLGAIISALLAPFYVLVV